MSGGTSAFTTSSLISGQRGWGLGARALPSPASPGSGRASSLAAPFPQPVFKSQSAEYVDRHVGRTNYSNPRFNLSFPCGFRNPIAFSSLVTAASRFSPLEASCRLCKGPRLTVPPGSSCPCCNSAASAKASSLRLSRHTGCPA